MPRSKHPVKTHLSGMVSVSFSENCQKTLMLKKVKTTGETNFLQKQEWVQ